jgi:hypothetical protein
MAPNPAVLLPTTAMRVPKVSVEVGQEPPSQIVCAPEELSISNTTSVFPAVVLDPSVIVHVVVAALQAPACTKAGAPQARLQISTNIIGNLLIELPAN